MDKRDIVFFLPFRIYIILNVDTLQKRPIFNIGFAPYSEEGLTYTN